MKSKLLYILCCILLSIAVAHASTERSTGAHEDHVLGIWAEFWGKDGWESDVDYVDTIKISVNTQGLYEMTCINTSDYVYDLIERDGRKLNFRMENISDPDEKFYVNYEMKLSKDGSVMEGECLNSRDAHNYVHMIRQ